MVGALWLHAIFIAVGQKKNAQLVASSSETSSWVHFSQRERRTVIIWQAVADFCLANARKKEYDYFHIWKKCGEERNEQGLQSGQKAVRIEVGSQESFADL